MKRLALWFVALIALACSGPGGLVGGGKLDEAECRQLMKKIDDVMMSGLSASERAEAAQTPLDTEDAMASCLKGESWNREGFECAMKANSKTDLDACILSSN